MLTPIWTGSSIPSRVSVDALDGGDAVSSTEQKRRDDGLVLSVSVHRADRLRPDLSVSHPMVRVHLVDMDSGSHVKKSSRWAAGWHRVGLGAGGRAGEGRTGREVEGGQLGGTG